MPDVFEKFGNSIGLGLFLLVVIILGVLLASGKIDFFGWANNMLDNSFSTTPSASKIIHSLI